jgi:quercetin dioxygenase-like cupin family protein
MVPAADRPTAMRVAGFDIQALVSGDQAQCFEAFYTSGANNTGPAPHCHPWDETFFVIRGPVMFGVADQEQPIETGTLLHVPGGVRHWWRFEVEGEFLSFTSGKEAAAMYRDLATVPADAPKTDYRAVALRHGQEARPEG